MVLSCHGDSGHCRTLTEIVLATMNISLLVPHGNASPERTFSTREQDWQRTLFGAGIGHYAAMSVSTTAAVLWMSKKATMNYNVPHRITNVHVVSCQVIYLAFIGRYIALPPCLSVFSISHTCYDTSHPL